MARNAQGIEGRVFRWVAPTLMCGIAWAAAYHLLQEFNRHGRGR
jgi:hypothetical protein